MSYTKETFEFVRDWFGGEARYAEFSMTDAMSLAHWIDEKYEPRPIASPAPAPAANAAEVALIEGPMTPRQFAEKWLLDNADSLDYDKRHEVELAAAISAHFTPRLPMADEGQTRLHTDAEMLEAVAQAERRVFRALGMALGGPGWRWLPETRRKLTRRVRSVMGGMDKRPEVSNG